MIVHLLYGFIGFAIGFVVMGILTFSKIQDYEDLVIFLREHIKFLSKKEGGDINGKE